MFYSLFLLPIGRVSISRIFTLWFQFFEKKHIIFQGANSFIQFSMDLHQIFPVCSSKQTNAKADQCQSRAKPKPNNVKANQCRSRPMPKHTNSTQILKQANVESGHFCNGPMPYWIKHTNPLCHSKLMHNPMLLTPACCFCDITSQSKPHHPNNC